MTMVGSIIILERNVENGATTARISSRSDYAYSIIRYKLRLFTMAYNKKEGILFHGKIFEDNKKILKQKYFLICKSCLWCSSSYFLSNIDKFSRCPICHQDEIESLPLSDDEVYKFDYSSKRGISLEFKKNDDNKEKECVS
jgi:predicted Zn-ribbon and HTH transcriptional regulator